MSLTILSTPQILMPAYNPVPLVFTSTKQTSEGHQFILDIYSAGTTSNRITREKTPANPQGYGVFESHAILRNFVGYDMNDPNSTGVTSSYPSRFKYDLYLGEEYVFDWSFGDNFFTAGSVGFSSFTSTQHYFSVGDSVYIEQNPGYTHEEYNGVHTITSVPTSYSFVIDLAYEGSTPLNPGTVRYADNRKTIFSGMSAITSLWVNNAAISHLDWPSYDVDTFNMTGLSASFWTDAPDNYEMQLGNKAWLNFYSSTGGTAMSKLIVQTYDKNDNQLGIYTLNIAGSSNETYYKVGCGPWNLSATTLTVSGSSTLPVFTTEVASYTFYIQDTPGNQLTESKTFKINQDCENRYDNIEILFGDRKGSFLTRNFQLAHTEGDEIDKGEYTKPIGNYNPASNKWTYASKDAGRTTLYSNAQTKYRAVSNWIDINDVDYLRQLYSSSQVYWNRGGTLIPIIVTNKFHPIASLEVDRIFNLTIEFELAYMNEIPCN